MDFVQQTARLPVRFGPKALFRLAFHAGVCTDYFMDLQFPVDLPNDGSQVLIFPSIPLTGEKCPVLRIAGGRVYYSPTRFPHYIADLQGDFETYLNTFGSKSKSTLKRKVRKFIDSAGPNYFRQFKSAEEMKDFHVQARELSKRTYQETLLDHGLPDTPEFISGMVAMAEGNQVRAYILYSNNNAVAYLYCPAREGILYYDMLGYDPDFRALSPGTVLQYLAFEQLFDEKIFRTFDFEEGEGQHKSQFATRSIECYNLFVFRPSLKSVAYITFDYLFRRITKAVLYLAEKTGLRRRMRRFIR